MSVTIKVDPLNRKIDLLISQTLSPAAQSQVFAKFAAEQIDEVRQNNAKVLGRAPQERIFVDGREGAALESVKPTGTIVAEFDLFLDALTWIRDQLRIHSPVGHVRDKHPGLYRESHALFADGVEVASGSPVPFASEYLYVNTVPYARKIELGSSSQARDGVYQAVAILARQRFGNVAKITFTYRSIGGVDGRSPAVVVKV